MRWLVCLLVVALGIAAVVLGGADDSPGLQGIGVVLIVSAITFRIRALRQDRRRQAGLAGRGQ
ncbi:MULTISPECIES: hypothetical protein [Citricoccus]|uniref:hypothetical protein n=1 Tax=Citricoccus TaxID=169133 RepID=UPI000255F6DE|nr:hypothetical protein [Citricoccus sp. CH26A]